MPKLLKKTKDLDVKRNQDGTFVIRVYSPTYAHLIASTMAVGHVHRAQEVLGEDPENLDQASIDMHTEYADVWSDIRKLMSGPSEP